MKILAIETSCDDTGIALLEVKNRKLKILSNFVSSQIKIHKKWGGVVPNLAKREHQRNLPIILKKILKKDIPKIDLLAVTVGHGLEPCLWAGVNFAKSLAKEFKIPVIPVNHVEAHILINFLNRNVKSVFPAVCLIVSGGHTGLILMKGIGKYKLIGETRDDAAGECFDKVARILGLGYPGGPVIAAEAEKYRGCTHVFLPRPMIHQKNYDFSFSGLKTAVLYDFQSRSPKIRKSQEYIREICFEAQASIVDVLVKKTIKATKDFRVKSIILGGGVVANKSLRDRFEEVGKELGLNVIFPSIEYCTDNAVMIAVAAFFNKKKAGSWKTMRANANLKIGK